jgi:predicted acylesterase/phospholipase RssA
MPIPPIVPEARLSALFPPVVPDNPDKTTFELGLVLGGTVSVGAYTAGALDFLLQALEAWQPNAAAFHRIVIKVAAGSSGGAVCASILGVLSGRVVPHITGAYAELVGNTAAQGNPLWDVWVNQLQIAPMFTTTDIDAGTNVDAGTGATLPHVQHVAALLNAEVIDQAAAGIAAFGTQTPATPLPYFAQPFRAALTVANLRGVPYQVADVPALPGFDGAAYMQHDDFAWFAVPNGADSASALPAGKREDEFWIGPGASASGFVGYDTLASFAVASAAMPLVLPARALTRPAEHYNYRPLVRAVTDLPAGWRIDWPVPDWSSIADAAGGTYAFTAVDGGTLNNDPVSLVHRSLVGLVGRNPRGASDATRAILMIDPLADAPSPMSPTGKSLVAVLGGIIPTLVGGARYLTADMALFADTDVFSRFQMVPFRTATAAAPATAGEAALAGDSLFAAAGWCAREFRVHDFLLGRHNMQEYLRSQLLLAGDNPLFSQWQFGDRQDYATDRNGGRMTIDVTTPGSAYFLPILPDKTGSGPLALPPWPVGAFNPADILDPLEKRLTAATRALIDDNSGGGMLPWLVNLLAVPGVVDVIASTVVNGFTAELQQAGLLKPADASA